MHTSAALSTDECFEQARGRVGSGRLRGHYWGTRPHLHAVGSWVLSISRVSLCPCMMGVGGGALPGGRAVTAAKAAGVSGQVLILQKKVYSVLEPLK